MREMYEKMQKNAEIIVEKMIEDSTFKEEFMKDPKMALSKLESLEIPDQWADLTIARARQEFLKKLTASF